MPVENDKPKRSRSRSPLKSEDGRRGRSLERKRSPGRSKSKDCSPMSRERAADRERGKKPPAPGSRDTNSNDPTAIRRRIFVGNLNTDKVTREEVEAHFCKFGKIIACSLHMNFGFIEYATEKEADNAVEQAHGTTIFEKRIDCNIASDRRRPQMKDKGNAPRRTSPKGGRGGDGRSRSPHRFRRSPSPMSRYDALYRRDDPLGRHANLEDGEGVSNDFKRAERNTFGGEDNNRYGDSRPYDNARPDAYARRDAYPRREDGRDSYPREGGQGNRYEDFPPTKTTDCEIIVTSRDIRSYGDSIETRLRAMGIISNLVFPPADVQIVDVLDRIGKSGCLYTVMVNTQNEFHRSCTLNILHGTPQEHRNMPLDDALAFVARNFDQYLKDIRDKGNALRVDPPSSSSSSRREGSFQKSSLVQDTYIAKLLDLAVSGKALKVPEINHLIEAFIKYKREIEPPEDTGNSSQSTNREDSHLEPDNIEPLGSRLASTAHFDSPASQATATTTSWSAGYSYDKREALPSASAAATSPYIKAGIQPPNVSHALAAASDRIAASFYGGYGTNAAAAAAVYNAFGAKASSQGSATTTPYATAAALASNFYAGATLPVMSNQQAYYYDDPNPNPNNRSGYPYGS